MQANNKNRLIKKNGNTADIISVVISTYNTYYQQVNDLAQSFKSDGFAETCKRIFDSVINNVRYIEDPDGLQLVKNPARLMKDGTGDCKSMAIYVASCLRCLGIDHFFRFVSFGGSEYTHVYVIAIQDNKQIIIDPVVRINGSPVFDFEQNYSFKKDMRGTDIYQLTGINKTKNSQNIGNAPAVALYLGTRPEMYSKAKMSLLSFLDLYIEEAQIITDQKALLEKYNDLNKISLAIYALEKSESKDQFIQACYVIASMSVAGYFSLSSINESVISDTLQSLYNSFDNYNGDLQVYDGNLLHFLTDNAIIFFDENRISGIGSSAKQAEIAAKIKESAMYYIYKYIPESDFSKYPITVLKKRAVQADVYDYVDSVDTYNNSSIQANLVRSGIIAQTGKTPEDFLNSKNLNEYKLNGIGVVQILVVIGVIQGILSIISLLVQLFGKSTKRAEPTDEQINKGLADFQTDFPVSGSGSTSTNTKSSSLMMFGIPALLITGGLLYSKKRKKNGSISK